MGEHTQPEPRQPTLDHNLPESRGNAPRPGFCPKCGAYVGAFYKCPACLSKMPHGRRLRAIQIIIIASTISGLTLLGLYARINPAPVVNIGDLSPTYSNGSVTIRGQVTNIDYRVARDNSWRTLIFTVTDATGSVDVKVYTETTDQMILAHNTPAIGDPCSVRGSVYVKGEDLYLLLDDSSYFQPNRVTTFNLNSSDLQAAYASNPAYYQGRRARVNGTVTQVGGDGSYFDIDDGVRVYFPDYVREFSPNVTISLIEGDIVSVVGVIEDYYSNIEILPATMYDITIIQYGGGSLE